MPVLFGMAVDGAVHMVMRHAEDGDLVATVSETGRAVAGAILTTTLGFAAFTLAHHPGLGSLGRVAVLGLAVNLVVCLVLLPSGIALVERIRGQRDGRGIRLVVTTGLAGDSPVAPGTMGALVALPLGFLAQRLAAARSWGDRGDRDRRLGVRGQSLPRAHPAQRPQRGRHR